MAFYLSWLCYSICTGHEALFLLSGHAGHLGHLVISERKDKTGTVIAGCYKGANIDTTYHVRQLDFRLRSVTVRVESSKCKR